MEAKGLKARGLTAPMIWKNHIIVGDKLGVLHAISLKTGEFIGQLTMPGSIISAPVVEGDACWVLTTNGQLHRLSMRKTKMLPVIAIVGRPNVGKSTLFNVITKSKAALVADFPGVTRDRQYGKALYQDKPFMVVDTSGLGEEDNHLDALASQQANLALDEADVIFFIVDGRAGLTPVDIDIAHQLRKMTKPLYVLINKTESMQQSIAASEFQRLGFKNIYCISAAHSRGVYDVLI